MSEVDDHIDTYAIVVNDEEQFSIWVLDRPLPAGWSGSGFTGSESECLARIAEIWTDMRPASLRAAMDRDGSVTAEPT